jgi:hypothetical protein
MQHFKFALAVILVSALTVAISAEPPPTSPFRIEVEVSGSGAKMRCTKGCGWETTSYWCEGATTCSFVLDESGIAGR